MVSIDMINLQRDPTRDWVSLVPATLLTGMIGFGAHVESDKRLRLHGLASVTDNLTSLPRFDGRVVEWILNRPLVPTAFSFREMINTNLSRSATLLDLVRWICVRPLKSERAHDANPCRVLTDSQSNLVVSE